MPKKLGLDAATAFPRIADHIRKAGKERYISHWELVEKLVDDPIVRDHASDEYAPLGIATKMVGVFSKCFTTGEMAHLMESYR